jgi:hypothetical protein
MPQWWRDAISRGNKGKKKSPEHCEAIRQVRIGSKASEEARQNMKIAARKRADEPGWAEKVSEHTRIAMYRPDVRKRHLKGLNKARKVHGVNFKGGNSQEPVPFVKLLAESLIPAGFVQEYPITRPGMKGRYKLDFAHLEAKVDIEADGPHHRPWKEQEKDVVRDVFLKSLGWRVIRVKHD